MAGDDNTGLLGYLAGAVHVRAAGYREKAAKLRRMAEREPIGRLRTGLLDLSRQCDGIADSIDPTRER